MGSQVESCLVVRVHEIKSGISSIFNGKSESRKAGPSLLYGLLSLPQAGEVLGEALPNGKKPIGLQ